MPLCAVCLFKYEVCEVYTGFSVESVSIVFCKGSVVIRVDEEYFEKSGVVNRLKSRVRTCCVCLSADANEVFCQLT